MDVGGGVGVFVAEVDGLFLFGVEVEVEVEASTCGAGGVVVEEGDCCVVLVAFLEACMVLAVEIGDCAVGEVFEAVVRTTQVPDDLSRGATDITQAVGRGGGYQEIPLAVLINAVDVEEVPRLLLALDTGIRDLGEINMFRSLPLK